MFWKETESKVLKSRITIYFDISKCQEREFSLIVPVEKENKYLEPWFYFIKWYHCRDSSESLSMRHSDGRTIIKKQNITGYKIIKKYTNNSTH